MADPLFTMIAGALTPVAPFSHAVMNATYASYFPADRRPARTTIGVIGLARGPVRQGPRGGVSKDRHPRA